MSQRAQSLTDLSLEPLESLEAESCAMAGVVNALAMSLLLYGAAFAGWWLW